VVEHVQDGGDRGQRDRANGCQGRRHALRGASSFFFFITIIITTTIIIVIIIIIITIITTIITIIIITTIIYIPAVMCVPFMRLLLL
jgi:hypothetical protein